MEYKNFPIVVNALIVDTDGRILIGRRAHSDGKGRSDLIGGFVESGETLESALRREVKEETGRDPINLAYFNSYTGHYSDGRDLLSAVFVCELSGDPIPSEEMSSFEYVESTPIDMFADCDIVALNQYFSKSR